MMRGWCTWVEMFKIKGIIWFSDTAGRRLFSLFLFKHCLSQSLGCLSVARNISSLLRQKIIKTFTRKKVAEHKLLKNSSHSSWRGTLFSGPSSLNINKH